MVKTGQNQLWIFMYNVDIHVDIPLLIQFTSLRELKMGKRLNKIDYNHQYMYLEQGPVHCDLVSTAVAVLDPDGSHCLS